MADIIREKQKQVPSALNALLDSNSSSVLEKALEEAVKKWDAEKAEKDRLCAKGEHQGWLTGCGFSGGMIHFKCSNCGRVVSRPDLPIGI